MDDQIVMTVFDSGHELFRKNLSLNKEVSTVVYVIDMGESKNALKKSWPS
jgi:hypothetical protein